MGRSVVQNSVLVRYILYGDATLDGVVDGADFSLIDSAYAAIQRMQAQVNWLNGNFNYDGSIDGANTRSSKSRRQGSRHQSKT